MKNVQIVGLLIVAITGLFAAADHALCQNHETPKTRYVGIDFTPEGNIALLDQAGCAVRVHDKKGKPVMKFGEKGSDEDQFMVPEGLVVDSEGRFIVADSGHDCISVFSPKGLHILSLGGPGSEDGQFLNPSDVAVDSEGQIYVADAGNNRLQIFSKEGDFLCTFGENGIEHGQFRCPYAIAVDSKDRVIVADRQNWRIEVFEKAEEPLEFEYSFTIYAQLAPTGLSVDPEDNILMTFPYGVRVFDKSGIPVGCLTSKEIETMKRPAGAIRDKDGAIYIADPETDSIHVSDDSKLTSFDIQREVKGVAVDSTGRIIVTEQGSSLVRVLDEEGNQVKEFGYPGPQTYSLTRPDGVCVDKNDSIYIADRDNHRIQVISKDFDFLMQIGSPGEEDGQFKQPCDVWVDADGYIYVADSGNHRIQVFDGKGSFVMKFGREGKENGEFRMPRSVTTDSRGNIIVADSGNCRVHVFSFDKEKKKARFLRASGPDFWSPSCVRVDEQDRIYLVEPGNRVAKVVDNSTLKMIESFRAYAAGGLSGPEGLCISGKDILIADTGNSRIVQTTTGLTDPFDSLSISDVTSDSATIEWETLKPSFSTLEYNVDGSPESEIVAEREKKTVEHSIKLDGLVAGTRYDLTVDSPLPIYLSEPRRYARSFVTLPGKGKVNYITMRLLVLLYRETTFRDKYPEEEYPGLESPPACSDEEVETIRKEIEEVRMFHWRFSKMKLNLVFDVVEISEHLELGDIGGSSRGYLLGPNERVKEDIRTHAEQTGKDISDYSGVIVLYRWTPRVDKKAKISTLAWGGTYGVELRWYSQGRTSYEFAYTVVPMNQEYLHQLDYKIIHEYQHQLQSCFVASGYMGYQSSDTPEAAEGGFGRHYDYVEHILRNCPYEGWSALMQGEVEIATDSDSDGFPDDDPALPLDERRFGSDPSKADSDGDGLSDVDEASIGLVRTCDPNDPDSDDDGVVDGKDPYPLNRVNLTVKKKTPDLDGSIGEEEWDMLTEFKDAEGNEGKVYANHDNSFLYVALETPTSNTRDILLDIDLMNDGWCHGWENVRFRCMGKFSIDEVWNRNEEPESRRLNESLVKGIKKAGGKTGETFVMEFAVPLKDITSLNPPSGKKVSLQVSPVRSSSWAYIGIFEPRSAEVILE